MDVYIIGYILIFLGIIISVIANLFVKITYKKYLNFENSKGLTGFDVARKILDKNNLQDIHVVEVRGYLTDHYDPNRKVVRLSSEVFHENSIASLAVAAHEVGHALQDANNYWFMKFRSFLVPFVNFISRAGYFAILIGIIFGYGSVIYIAIAMELATLLFQIVTLPVEFNASKRALLKIREYNLVTDDEYKGTKSVLFAAAFTYVASLVTILLQLLRLLLIAGSRRDD